MKHISIKMRDPSYLFILFLPLCILTRMSNRVRTERKKGRGVFKKYLLLL